MEGSKRHLGAMAGVGLLLSALLIAGWAQYCLAYKWQVAYAAVLWPLALALFALALWWTPRERRALPGPHGGGGWSWQEKTLAILACALGVFFKVYKLDEFPPGLNHDAAWEGQYALAILRGTPYTPFISAAWGRETLTFYFRAPFVWWLGNVPLAVYLPSVIAGILLLPFLYWWVRTMFGARVAWLATALLGVSGWSLVFSRTGWRSDFQPLFTILTCCFFWRGLETRKVWHFMLAGVFLAATANTYNAGQVFPLVFLLWVPLFALQGWTLRGFLRSYGRGLAAGAFSFALAIAPLAWYALHNWEKFFGRQSFLLQQWSFPRAFRSTILMFHYWANGDDFFTNTPGLEYLAAIFFPLGLLWCLVAIRDSRAQFAVIGLAVGLLPGLLSTPNMNRDIGAMPFVYVLAALGVVFCAQEVARVFRRSASSLAATVLAGGVVLASAWATYAQYLGPNRRNVWGYYPETTVLGRFLAGLDPSYRVWVMGTQFPVETLTYLLYRGGDPFTPSFTRIENPPDLLQTELPPPNQRSLAFAFPDETVSMIVMAELRARYPQHEIVSLRYPPQENGRVFARVLLVPPAATPASGGGMPAQPAAPAPQAGAAPQPAEDLRSLSEPRGIAVFADGTIVVSDFGHDRLVWFDAKLQPQFAVGGVGSASGQFKQPTGLAIGPGEELFVCDTWNHRIQVLSKTGQYKRQYTAGFFSPRGVAVARDGTVFVADSGNNRVVVLRTDGEVLDKWDDSTTGAALREPIGIAVHPNSGLVFVTDNGQARIHVLTRSGEKRASFSVEGLALQALSEPQLSWGSGVRLWVNVPHRHEVRLYQPTGELQRTVPIQIGEQAAFPMGVAEDSPRRRLLVTTAAGRLLALPLEMPASKPRAATRQTR
ncbi:MAG: hypothetical protein KatS3mg077_1725 [Candidatus Binatia bacterium]|nr:MAG: hypothetical protein KatS3mg077_1725 [Candidatus Binatia bacterium]